MLIKSAVDTPKVRDSGHEETKTRNMKELSPKWWFSSSYESIMSTDTGKTIEEIFQKEEQEDNMV